jgi:methionine synthase II (cobalamin-independent)
MPAKFEFNCLPTAIGSMPQTEPEEACSIVMKYLPDIPAWPQLPKRSPKENMCIQFSEGFPGIVIAQDKIHIEPWANFETELGQIYADCEQDNPGKYGVSVKYAAGFHAFLSTVKKAEMVKGQITGPITWGLTVTRQDGLAILYDETLAEVAAKFLRLKAAWQENALRKISPNPIIFVDEPYLVSLGSVFTPIPEDKVAALLEEVFQGIKGIKGLHCCGNTNWPVLLGTTTDILSFDAYNYASSFGSYPNEVKSFLTRGGTIAWGIVPNDEEALAKESLSSLHDRLGEAMAPFTRNGISFKQILRQGLLTPSCGLTALSPEAACQALELVAKLSHNLRERYTI